MNKEFASGYVEGFAHALKTERDKIKSDLLTIADKGEIEDLRREVEDYFSEKSKDTNPEVSIPKVKKEDEYHIDEIVHNLEALDFNSREARENVNQVLQTFRNTIKTQVKQILTEEINIAHSEGEKTSRLTSAFNRITIL